MIIAQTMPRPPDLQELIERRGGYHKITGEDWAKYDAMLEEWRAIVREGGCYQRVEPPPPDDAMPEPPGFEAPPTDADYFDEAKYEQLQNGD